MSRKWENKFGNQFLEKHHEVILQIGRDSFSRQDIVEHFKCYHMQAAKNLGFVLERFHPKSVRELARHITPEDFFYIGGVGETTMWVWMCAMEHVGLNSQEWLDVSEKVPTLYDKVRRSRRKIRKAA